MRSVHPLLSRSNTLKIIEYLKGIYKENERSREHNALFVSFTRNLRTFEKSRLVGSFVMAIAFAISPIIIYLVNGGLAVILPMYIPGTSATGFPGYPINIFFQICAFYFGVLTFSYYDMLFIFQLFHIVLLANIMRRKIRIFNRVVMMDTHLARADLDEKMRDLLRFHVDILRCVILKSMTIWGCGWKYYWFVILAM